MQSGRKSKRGNGSKLEDKFYDYLRDQQKRGSLVYDGYPSQLCEIHKKKKYYCRDREQVVEFDVVIEFYRQGSVDPRLYVVFEGKNHRSAIQERDVTDFSDKIGRIFKHACKGTIVVSSRLQSGAETLAKNRKMGIVKYDEHGLDVIADRKSGIYAENRFVKKQIFKTESHVKSL